MKYIFILVFLIAFTQITLAQDDFKTASFSDVLDGVNFNAKIDYKPDCQHQTPFVRATLHSIEVTGFDYEGIAYRNDDIKGISFPIIINEANLDIETGLLIQYVEAIDLNKGYLSTSIGGRGSAFMADEFRVSDHGVEEIKESLKVKGCTDLLANKRYKDASLWTIFVKGGNLRYTKPGGGKYDDVSVKDYLIGLIRKQQKEKKVQKEESEKNFLNGEEESLPQNSSESSLNSNATSNALQNTNTSKFQDPWAIGESNEAFFDPAEVIKSDVTDLFTQLASETGNERLGKVAENCQNVRGFAMAFKAANPDYIEQIGKIENYSMLVGILAPFIFDQSNKPDEAQLRQNDLANIREHDARIKSFEKTILVDLLTVKEQLMKFYAKGEYDKFTKYYKGYITLLNTPVAMYNPDGLVFNFYSDLDRNNSWDVNKRNNPMSPELEKKFNAYNLNTTLGEIYYGTGKEVSAKKVLDALFLMSVNPKTKDQDILKLLDKYPLYDNGWDMFDFQPYLFAMNYAHNNNREDLFNRIWENIDASYNAIKNPIHEIQVSEKVGEQRKHLKSIGYTVLGAKAGYQVTGAKEDALTGIMNSMSYSVLKRRYDLIKEKELDTKFGYNNIIFSYSAIDLSKGTLSYLDYLGLSKFDKAYLLRMMMENIFGVQAEGIRTDDKKLFLSVMRKGMKISNTYNKLTDGKNAKEKNNYFSPTYHNEVNVIFFSIYDYVVHAKGYATLSNAIGDLFMFDNEYLNPSFYQDANLMAARINWYNAWAHYYRKGDRSQINSYITTYGNNPYAILEWLISYGIPVKYEE